jgi:hypothetical protein
MHPFLIAACVLLAAACQERALGLNGQAPNTLLGLVALVLALVALVGPAPSPAEPGGGAAASPARPTAQPTIGRRVWAGGIAGTALMLLGLIAWIGGVRIAQPFALAVALGGAVLVQRPGGSHQRLAGALLGFALLHATCVTVRDHLPLWWLYERASVGFSGAVSELSGRRLALGPQYAGTHLGVIAGVYAAAHLLGARQRRWMWAVLVLALLPLAVALHVALGTIAWWWPWAAQQPLLDGVDAPIILFGLLLLPIGLLWRTQPLAPRGGGPRVRSQPGSQPDSQPPSQPRSQPGSLAARRPWLAAGVGLTLLVLGIILATWERAVPAAHGRVTICTRGTWSTKLPVWGLYGSQATTGANASALPLLLQDAGFTVALHDTVIDDALLQGTDVLFFMDLGEKLDPAERQAIWRFVERGGGLLVLGDHTDIQGVMHPTNELLEPVGVRLKFDSAIPFVPRWTWYNAMRLHPHPALRGLRDESDVKVSVGASLQAPPGARPLLTGRLAFSDAGNLYNARGAYLGNMQYDAGERTGDILLAVEARYGRGKVVVFGDTSSFQVTSSPNTVQMVCGLFQYLADPRGHGPGAGRRLAGSLLLVAGALLLVASGELLPAALAAAAVAGWLALAATDAHGRVDAPRPTHGALAYLDLAHGNRVDLHAGQVNGINGLLLTLMRAGLLPQGHKDFDPSALQRAELAVVDAPAFSFSAGEIRALHHYVEQGGNLIVSVGWEERNGAQALLSSFGYAIGRTPIGAAHDAICSIDRHYANMHESWPVERPAARGEVLVSSWNYPLIVLEAIGKGHLLVIGDSFFLLDGNLESSESFNANNILFVRAVLERMLGRELGPPEEPSHRSVRIAPRTADQPAQPAAAGAGDTPARHDPVTPPRRSHGGTP